MKTRRFCPHCGHPVLKSNTKGYAFQCFYCDEDFTYLEVLRKKNLKQVQAIRRETILHERQQDYTPYPRSNKPKLITI